eukprot:scaffold12979_cov38-Attheya_sp.AAC.1
MDISIGEIKNSSNYSTYDAIDQTACYLMLLMYWWRACFGREMEDVYGFAVCGPLFKDTKGTTGKRNFLGHQRIVHSAQYSISIVKLSAPATLGKMNAVTVLSNSYDVSNYAGMRLLCRFMSSKRIWNQMRNVAQVDHPCAALLCAPQKFIEKANESTEQWKYVRNGTSCLVFECKGAEGVKAALEMTSQAAYQELMKDWG